MKKFRFYTNFSLPSMNLEQKAFLEEFFCKITYKEIFKNSFKNLPEQKAFSEEFLLI